MVRHQKDCRILVAHSQMPCVRRNMEVNLRRDGHFVEDELGAGRKSGTEDF